MKRRPRGLAAVLILATVSLLALALTGLMEWISAVLFLAMEFTAEFLRPFLERRRPNRHVGPAPVTVVHPSIRRVNLKRRGPPRRPRPRLRDRGRGMSPC